MHLEEKELKESCDTLEKEYNILFKTFSEFSSELAVLVKSIFDLKEGKNNEEIKKRRLEENIDEEKKTTKKIYSDPFKYDLLLDINHFFEEYPGANLAGLCNVLVDKYYNKKAVTFNNIKDIIENSSANEDWQEEKSMFMQAFGIPPVKEFKYEEINNIKVKELFGYDKIVNACVEHIESAFEKKSDKNQNIILYGPPGNGKTVLVDAICFWIKNRENVLIFKLSPSELNTANDVNALQAQLKELLKKKDKKVVIFIDEIDGIAPARKSGKNGERDVTVTALLTFVNNMNKEHFDDVVIMMATNYLNNVDSALICSGRFDNKYHVGNPNYDTRKTIIENLLKIEEKIEEKIILLNFLTIGQSVATVEAYAKDNKDKILGELEDLFIGSVVNNTKKEVDFVMISKLDGEIEKECKCFLINKLYKDYANIIKRIEWKKKDIMNVDEVLDSNRNITFKFDLEDLGIKRSYEDVSFNELIRKMIVEFINMNNVMQEQLKGSKEKDQEILKTIEKTNKKTEESMGVLKDLTDKLTKTFTEEVQKLNNATIEEMKHNNEKLSEEFFNTIKKSMMMSAQNTEKLTEEIMKQTKELSVSIYAQLNSQKEAYEEGISLNQKTIEEKIQSFAREVSALAAEKLNIYGDWARVTHNELIKKIAEYSGAKEEMERQMKGLEKKQAEFQNKQEGKK